MVADDFAYDVALDRLTCRAGKHSIGKTRLTSCAGDQYYFSTRDCRDCEHAQTCLTKGEREGAAMPRRRVALTDARKVQQAAGETHHQQMKVRSRIEPTMDQAAARLGPAHSFRWLAAGVVRWSESGCGTGSGQGYAARVGLRVRRPRAFMIT